MTPPVQEHLLQGSHMVQKQVAIVLWNLVTPDTRSIANHFQVRKSTVRVMVVQVCKEINTVIYPCVTATGKVQEIITGFQKREFCSPQEGAEATNGKIHV